VKLPNTVRVTLAEDIMTEAHRFSRQARGDRRAADSATEHRLLDEEGRCLGCIGETAEHPVFGPLEPTVYLDRHRKTEQRAERMPNAQAHRKEGVK